MDRGPHLDLISITIVDQLIERSTVPTVRATLRSSVFEDGCRIAFNDGRHESVVVSNCGIELVEPLQKYQP
jgi:hypothetical protein